MVAVQRQSFPVEAKNFQPGKANRSAGKIRERLYADDAGSLQEACGIVVPKPRERGFAGHDHVARTNRTRQEFRSFRTNRSRLEASLVVRYTRCWLKWKVVQVFYVPKQTAGSRDVRVR